jgi:hypothetical protein
MLFSSVVRWNDGIQIEIIGNNLIRVARAYGLGVAAADIARVSGLFAATVTVVEIEHVTHLLGFRCVRFDSGVVNANMAFVGIGHHEKAIRRAVAAAASLQSQSTYRDGADAYDFPNIH